MSSSVGQDDLSTAGSSTHESGYSESNISIEENEKQNVTSDFESKSKSNRKLNLLSVGSNIKLKRGYDLESNGSSPNQKPTSTKPPQYEINLNCWIRMFFSFGKWFWFSMLILIVLISLLLMGYMVGRHNGYFHSHGCSVLESDDSMCRFHCVNNVVITSANGTKRRPCNGECQSILRYRCTCLYNSACLRNVTGS